MNFIPYPRVDKNSDASLEAWRRKVHKREGDWKSLKSYLSENCRLINGLHVLTKCWYSELHQGDNYVLDVEHFRPKNKANPLNKKDMEIIEKILGFPLLQDDKEGYKYEWLEFDYRNYRIVTGLTNRGGAKHIYFPVFKNTKRLVTDEKPWEESEFSIFLDPVNKHDASLLIVQPDGKITPKTLKEQLTQKHIDDLPASWNNAAFNYTRAVVTIKMYRLDENVFNQARKECYDNMTSELLMLTQMINENVSEKLMRMSIKRIVMSILPSAQFSLASKCSLINYIPDSKYDTATVKIFNDLRSSILTSVDDLVDKLAISWKNP